jgi:hypothetical protein
MATGYVIGPIGMVAHFSGREEKIHKISAFLAKTAVWLILFA